MTQKEYASKLISAFYAEFGMERECYGEHPKTLNPAYNLYAGLFRLTIVPKNANFILKLGKTDTGDEQNENETRIYKLAQEKNLQHWFAKPLFVVNAELYTWHAYEKAYFIGEAGQSPLKVKEVSDEITERYCSALCTDEIDEWPHYIAHEKLLIVLLISLQITELTTFITVIGAILSGRVILSSPTMRDVGFNKIVTIL